MPKRLTSTKKSSKNVRNWDAEQLTSHARQEDDERMLDTSHITEEDLVLDTRKAHATSAFEGLELSEDEEEDDVDEDEVTLMTTRTVETPIEMKKLTREQKEQKKKENAKAKKEKQMAKRLEEDLLMAHTAMASPDEVVQQPQDKELEPQLQAMIEAYVEGGDKAPLVLPSMGVELRRVVFGLAKERGLETSTRGDGSRKEVVLSFRTKKLPEKLIAQAKKRKDHKLSEVEVESHYRPCIERYAAEKEAYAGVLANLNSFERRIVYIIAESVGVTALSRAAIARGDGSQKDVVLSKN